MPRFLRLIIWDALFFLIISGGYAAVQYLGAATAPAYLVSVMTCVVGGAFLAQLSVWGISWMELCVVGLPALYLAFAPFLSVALALLPPLPITLIPTALVLESSITLRLAGAATAGFLFWNKIR